MNQKTKGVLVFFAILLSPYIVCGAGRAVSLAYHRAAWHASEAWEKATTTPEERAELQKERIREHEAKQAKEKAAKEKAAAEAKREAAERVSAYVDAKRAKAQRRVDREIAKYELAKRGGDRIEICYRAGKVAATAMHVGLDEQYLDWKKTETAVCP